MPRKIKLELTEVQFKALVSVVSTCSAVMDECPHTAKEIALIDRGLAKNGYKRTNA